MHWEPMTIDEYALYQRAVGTKVLHKDGVWWVEVRPFFYRPLFLFTQIRPWSRRYPSKCLVGGVIHLVPQGEKANTTMSFFIYDNLRCYSLESLSPKRKRITMQGLKNLTVRPIPTVDEFVDSAYEVYLSFYERTKYAYRKDRVERMRFRLWAEGLYANDKILKIGAYHGDTLCAAEISYRVQDVIFGSTLFSDTHSLNLKVTDFLIHTLREAAARTDARFFFTGLPSGRQSLDESKVIRGCKLLKMPAYFRVNPLGLVAAKLLMPDSYRKLLTVTSQHTADRAAVVCNTEPPPLDVTEALGGAVEWP